MGLSNESVGFARLTEPLREPNLLKTLALLICAEFVIFNNELELKIKI